MIQFTFSERPLHEERVDGYMVFCEQDQGLPAAIETLRRFYEPLASLLEKREFTGRAGSSLVIAGADGDRPVYLILAGLGKKIKSSDHRLEMYRRALGSAIRGAEGVKAKTVAIQVPPLDFFEIDMPRLGRETATIIDMAAYHFDDFFSEEASKRHKMDITLCFAPEVYEEGVKGAREGCLIGDMVTQARTWCDLPPKQLTPTILADQAKKIAQATNLKCTVFTEPEIIKMGMGGLAGVSAGSAEECRLVVLEYKCDDPAAKTIALVGKGITFDSGGLSLKPANSMETMKDDMAGAASVIATMQALAHFKPKVNVVGLAAISENLPSGTATKPGDILRFYNGKTAEVLNTDAEGRLVLADAMAYAVKHYAPDAIITLATLTGSCAYALGPFYCGLMSQEEDLSKRIVVAGQRTGERAWPLPFDDDYKPAIKSHIADIQNIGSEKYRAGAITAGFFLKVFADEVPFAHLDIAGTSFNVPDISYYRPGATGFGVRLCVDMIMHWE